ncbi:MAG: 4-hydroxy-tetrahydrodipicolinate synthase [Alphaproteobacteria bacterium]|nr:4-hydroxy-tetrahydrodipicolinate synthase [Alphaproteobacteria bacterium]MBR6009859.1 4-hydroxy-tetrahydrodipicolinate synthase [Alphaproteobacteria bacterium]
MVNDTDFGKVITAMVTPFLDDDNNTVDLAGAINLANYLLKNGTDSLLLVGSTGEAAQLSSREKQYIIKNVRQNTPKDTKIIVSTGDTNTNRVIEKSNCAFDLGADAVLISVPEYIKPPQKDLYAHFSNVAKSVSNKPIFIYNIPSRTGTEILPDTIAHLAHDNPNIIGVKQSMPDLDKVSEIRIKCPATFQIYSGDDSLTLPMLSLGAKGVVSVASHLAGKMINQMITNFNSNPMLSQQYHQMLYPLFKSLFMTTNPIPIKQALYNMNLISSPVLRTLGTMTKQDQEKLSNALAEFEIQKNKFLNAQHIKTRA